MKQFSRHFPLIAGFASLLFSATTIFLYSFHTAARRLLTQIPQNGIDNTTYRESSQILENISGYRAFTAGIAVFFAILAIRKGPGWFGWVLFVVSLTVTLAQLRSLFV